MSAKRASRSSKKGGGSIFDRLTDPSQYTGAHKHRFDADGKGRGLAGRDMGNETLVSDLSQLTRAEMRKSVDGKKKARRASKRASNASGIDLSNVQKFGTQADKAKVLLVFQNGDKHHKGVQIRVRKGINTFAKLLDECTKKLTITTGACKKLYRVNQETKKFGKITDLDKLNDGDVLLACGPEPIKKDRLPATVFKARVQ
eukprot:TRINITY_DN29524_c0_g1_i1.p2 TRINITY_DN29524_c0_g1~~TRINITY_DN29524_c0_g1_i1.p2  ORF type:complete len:201 (+),score=111.14 TRINITY_DN29524_c0_g1_i1:132-734(+)